VQIKPTLEDTLALMRDLRARCDWGCGTDARVATAVSELKKRTRSTYAIRGKNDAALREELGDLLLQVLFTVCLQRAKGVHDGRVAAGFIAKMKAVIHICMGWRQAVVGRE